MIDYPVIKPDPKELLDRYQQLQSEKCIFDMLGHAEAYRSLGNSFAKVGMQVNAALCYSTWRSLIMAAE